MRLMSRAERVFRYLLRLFPAEFRGDFGDQMAATFDDPGRLVLLFEQLPNAPFKFGFSPPDFEIVRDLARSYSRFAAYRNVGLELSGVATPERLNGARVSPGLFAVLGVGPAIGRALTEDDDRQDAKVAVVSHNLWTQTFGRDPSTVGGAISLDGQPYTVVGIMPEGFVFPPRKAGLNGRPADVFVPMSFTRFERQAFGMLYNNTFVARLASGVSIEQARAELSSLVPTLTDRYPPFLQAFTAKLSIPITPLREETVAGSRRLLLVLMAAVGLVLLIACADVACLILTRSASRQRELAIRAALGASRIRIVRQLLTEAAVLGAAGSALGLLLAYWLTRVLLFLAGEKLPRMESIGFDYRIVLFAVALALITPLAFGVVPAIRAARATTGDARKETARAIRPARRRLSQRGLLFVGPFAIAFVTTDGL